VGAGSTFPPEPPSVHFSRSVPEHPSDPGGRRWPGGPPRRRRWAAAGHEVVGYRAEQGRAARAGTQPDLVRYDRVDRQAPSAKRGHGSTEGALRRW